MKKKFFTALRTHVGHILSLSLPLYFVASAVFLSIIAGLVFSFLAQRAERDGPESVFLGETIQSLAALPGVLTDAVRTIRTDVQQVNPQVVGQFKPNDLTRFSSIMTAEGVPVINGTKLYATPDALRGWRVVIGYFDIDSERTSAAILLDETMQVVHLWRLHEEDIDHPEKRDPLFKFPHGFDVLPDGSIFYAFDGGVSLKRVDIYGRTVWRKTGRYHHAITLSEDGKTLWSLRHAVDESDRAAFDDKKNRYLDQLDAATGNTLQTISLADVARANAQLSILRTRLPDNYDPYHENDVEPLPSSLAARFPQFTPGDLLVSLRNANLVFVLEPASQHVKWWRMGMATAQHDPDWLSNGLISIFDNSTAVGNSRIITVDPKTMAMQTTVPGEKFDFHTPGRGKHQVLPDGSVLVSSTTQGRIFEVSPTGDVVFELVNFIEGKTEEVLFLSEAKWIPADFFTPEALAIFKHRPSP